MINREMNDFLMGYNTFDTVLQTPHDNGLATNTNIRTDDALSVNFLWTAAPSSTRCWRRVLLVICKCLQRECLADVNVSNRLEWLSPTTSFSLHRAICLY